MKTMAKNVAFPWGSVERSFLSHHSYWIASLLFFAAQFIVIILFSQRLVHELGTWTLVVPLILFALFAGLLVRQRIAFVGAFIWSIMVLIHGFALLFIQFHPLQLAYIVFGLAQSWCLSRVALGAQ